MEDYMSESDFERMELDVIDTPEHQLRRLSDCDVCWLLFVLEAVQDEDIDSDDEQVVGRTYEIEQGSNSESPYEIDSDFMWQRHMWRRRRLAVAVTRGHMWRRRRLAVAVTLYYSKLPTCTIEYITF